MPVSFVALEAHRRAGGGEEEIDRGSPGGGIQAGGEAVCVDVFRQLRANLRNAHAGRGFRAVERFGKWIDVGETPAEVHAVRGFPGCVPVLRRNVEAVREGTAFLTGPF